MVIGVSLHRSCRSWLVFYGSSVVSCAGLVRVSGGCGLAPCGAGRVRLAISSAGCGAGYPHLVLGWCWSTAVVAGRVRVRISARGKLHRTLRFLYAKQLGL